MFFEQYIFYYTYYLKFHKNVSFHSCPDPYLLNLLSLLYHYVARLRIHDQTLVLVMDSIRLTNVGCLYRLGRLDTVGRVTLQNKLEE